MAVPLLPGELYELIFSHLEWDRRSDVGVKALARCAQTSRFVRSQATLSHIWRPHLECRYTTNDAARQAERLSQTAGSCYLLYSLRRHLDLQAIKILNAIIESDPGRSTLGWELAYELGLDVFDVLNMETMILWPKEILDIRPKAGVFPLSTRTRDWMSRPYWAGEALGVITRSEAVWGWKRLVECPSAVSLAEGLSYFSGFRGVSPAMVMRDIQNLCERCRLHLLSSGIILDSTEAEYDVVPICRAVCDWMRSQGFSRASANDYHAMDNHFLNCVLTTAKHTLPLSLVAIFVALARYVGLDAHPVGFPGQVQAMVQRVPPSNDAVYLDIFNSDIQLVLPIGQLIVVLDGFGVQPIERTQFLRAATTLEMCVRAAQNISHSYRREQGEIDGDLPHQVIHTRLANLRECLHAATTALSVLREGFGSPRTLQTTLEHVEANHRLDFAVMGKELKPGMVRHIYNAEWQQVARQLQKLVEMDERVSSVKRSADMLPFAVDGVPVQHHIGTIMKHHKYGYTGVLIGWNSKCEQSEEWMVQMGVDRLPRGRQQPFYTVASNDGSIRYVAEENVQTTGLPTNTWSLIRDVLENAMMIEGYFDRAEVGPNGVGRFIMGSDLQRVYPGDVVLCQRALTA